MVRYKPGHTELTRTRIVDAASGVFKTEGVAGARIEDVMGAVGMTVGGFYRHYESKDDLLCDALSRALADSREMIRGASGDLTGAEWLKIAAATYLNPVHKDNVSGGCALPALSADVARSGKKVRERFEVGLRALADEIASHLEGTPAEREQQAWQVTALFVGGLMLSRSVADSALSEKIMEGCRALYDDAPTHQEG